MEDLNSVTPVVQPMALSAKYRKVVIKNNRGPWKIANMLFKRSPKGQDSAQAHKNSTKHFFSDNQLKERDGLLVSKRIVNESEVQPPIDGEREGSGVRMSETVVPLTPESSVEDKFMRNLPKINLFSKSVDKKNLRNFKFSSDVDVIDLMEEDSLLRSHSFSDNNTFMVDLLTADRRKARSSPQFFERSLISDDSSPDQLKSDDKSGESFTPIRIFVFLNRNRKNKERQWRTDSSNNKYVAQRPQRRKAYELEADSSMFDYKRNASITTTTTTTTTVPPKTTTSIQIPIKRILKTFDLNEFEDRFTPEAVNIDNVEDKEEEDRYVEPTEPSTEVDTFTLTAAPVSRNWNFFCGKRKGFFADVDNDCRTYYQCSVRGRQRWECPPGTRFNQFSSTCDWMENVNCLAFKDLVTDKITVDPAFDSTTLPSTAATEPFVFTTPMSTPAYEADYEDPFEE